MSDEKPATKTAKIIPFIAPKSDYVLQCPDCDGIAWELIMVDVQANLSVTTLQCITEGCDYWTMGAIQMGSEHYE